MYILGHRVTSLSRTSKVILDFKSSSEIGKEFGNAVKDGNDEEVERMLVEHGLELLMAQVSIDITPDIDTRLTPPVIRRSSNVFRKKSVRSLASSSETTSRHGLMTVTAFNLGIIFRHRNVTRIMIERIFEQKEHEVQLRWLKNVLGFKAILISSSRSDQWGKDTLSLNGMNAFHIAARYNPEILKAIFTVLREKQWISEFQELIEQKNSVPLSQTCLHIAAKNTTAEATRFLLFHNYTYK